MKFLNDLEIGKRLESLRGNKSSRVIALAAGIDPSQYYKIEKGKSALTENILEKLVSTHKWDGNFILYGGIKVPHETETKKPKEYSQEDVPENLLKELDHAYEQIKNLKEIVELQKQLLEVSRKKDSEPLKHAAQRK